MASVPSSVTALGASVRGSHCTHHAHQRSMTAASRWLDSPAR